MSKARYRKIFKGNAEIKYPIKKDEDKSDGKKENVNLPKEG